MLSKYKIKVELIQNSAISFSVVLNNKYGGLDKLLDELKETFKVSVEKKYHYLQLDTLIDIL